MKYTAAGHVLLGLLIWSCASHSQSGPAKNEFAEAQKDSLQRIECDSILNELRKAKADVFGQVQSIPSDFEGCLRQLDSLTGNGMKEWIMCLPDGELSTYLHRSFGRYLRNNWGLWGSSDLALNLRKMGILHPDDMSSIILDSYQRKLKGEDIRLQEQLQYYQDYWRKNGTPVDSILQELKNNN
jgi:hypothetical protein